MLSQSQIEKFYEDKGCKLLDTYHNDSREKLRFICKCGAIVCKSYAIFRRGLVNCRECCNKNVKENNTRRYTIDYIKEILLKDGRKLISTEYISAKTKIEYICSCGTIVTKSFSKYLQNKPCRVCKKNCSNIQKIRKIIEDGKCIFIENENRNIKNSSTTIVFICKCGKKHAKTLANFKRYPYCNECGISISSNKHSGESHCFWQKDREKLKQNLKFKRLCRDLVRHTLIRSKNTKNDKTENLLNYKAADLLNRIINHPNWNSVKDDKWHIDHIFPIQAFIEYGIKEIKIINMLENLQPLTAKENLSKQDNYNTQEFEDWLTSKGIKFESKLNVS